MNLEQLKQALTVVDGKLVISQGALTPGIDSMLFDFYGGQPLVISGATRSDNGVVTVTGNSPFLNLPNAPVSATLATDTVGEVHATLTYPLIADTASTMGWTFSRSLPTLPPFPNVSAGNAGPRSFLDTLSLLEAKLVVASAPKQATDGDLSRGINFVGRMNAPADRLGAILTTLGTNWPIPMCGTIRVPQQTTVTPPLAPLQYPWDLPDPPPGVLLCAPLGPGASFGKMTLSDPRLYIYSPHDTTWLDRNPSFEPRTACTAMLSIPSASISARLLGWSFWGSGQLILTAREISGASLGKLADLADLAGADDLLQGLPAELQQAAGALSKLSLTGVELVLWPGLSRVGFTVGMPDLRWKIWGDHLEVTDIECMFTVSDPLVSGRQVGVTVWGTLLIEGVPVKVFASNEDGFAVWVQIDRGANIPLSQLLQSWAPGTAAPADLTVDSLLAYVAPGSLFSLSAALFGQSDPWQIRIGKKQLTVHDVVLGLDVPASGPASGAFGGTLEFMGASLQAAYRFPGGLTLRSTLPQLHLGRLLDETCDELIPLPDGFDLVLDNASVLIDLASSTPTFQLAALVADVGTVLFEVAQVGGRWGFVTGIALSGKMSSVPGLSALAALEDIVSIDGLTLVVASAVRPGFRFPALPSFNNPTVGATPPVLPATGIVPGLNLYGSMKLGESSGLNVVRDLLGLSPDTMLTVAVQIGQNPAQSAALMASISGKINDNVSLTGSLGAMLKNGSPSLFLNANVTVPIQGQTCVFTAGMLIDIAPPGAFLAGSMQGSIRFSGITLSNLGLLIGVGSSGLPSLGVAATVAVGKMSGSAAIFLNSANPSQSMLAGSVSDLSLKDVADTMAGIANFTVPPGFGDALGQIQVSGTQAFTLPAGAAADLERAAANLNTDTAPAVSTDFRSAGITIPADPRQLLVTGSTTPGTWFITDLSKMRHYQIVQGPSGLTGSVNCQLYVAPQATAIGTFKYPQGFYLNGKLTVFDYWLTATIQVSPSQGISVYATMSPIVIHSSTFFSLIGADGTGGPLLSMSTYKQPTQTDPDLRNPHLKISGKLTLLGCSQAVYISITSRGMEFAVTFTTTSSVVNWTVEGSITRGGASAKGAIAIDLKNVPPLDLGALGKVKLNTSLAGRLSLSYQSGKAGAELSGKAKLSGKEFSTGTLNVTGNKLDDLPQLVANALKTPIKDALGTAGQWLDWIKNGTVQGMSDVRQIAKTLKSNFKQGCTDVAKGLKTLGYGASDIYSALKEAAFEAGEILKALKGAGFPVIDVTSVIKSILGKPCIDAGSLLREAGYTDGEIAKGLCAVYKQSLPYAKQMVDVLYDLKIHVNDIGRAIKAHYPNCDDVKMASILEDLGYTSTEVAGTLKNVWKDSDREAAKALKSAGYSKDEVKDALKSVWNLSEDEVNDIFNEAIDWIPGL